MSRPPLFGNPEWFKTTHGGLGIAPVSARGWLFFALWAAAILLPTAGFVLATKYVESSLWILFAMFLLVRESRSIVHHKRRENLFVIDEDTDVTKVTTENYDLELRQ